MCGERYSEVTCAFGLIKLRSEMYSKVESEPKHEVATTERKFPFRKRITAPLHSTLAVNNLGLKFAS